MNATNIFLFRGNLGAIQTSGYFLIFYSRHRHEPYREHPSASLGYSITWIMSQRILVHLHGM